MSRCFKMTLLAISLAVLAGCASTGGNNPTGPFSGETAAERTARRKAEKEDRAEVQAARLEEAEDERQALRARREFDREERRKQLDERLSTKLSLNLDQRFSVGTLQVNTDQLKKLIDERDTEHKKRLKITEEANAEIQGQERQRLLAEARQWRSLQGASNNGRQGDCCSVPPQDCARPFRAIRAPLKQPLKQPILPTEIPLMLPVTLQVALDNPRFQQTDVRRLPLKQECQPCAPRCDAIPPCDARPLKSGSGVAANGSAGYSRISESRNFELPPAPPFDDAANEDIDTAIE